MAVPKLRFGCTDWKNVELKDIAKRVTRKNKKNETDLPLTISSLDGLVDQREYFNKQVASKDMSGYYLIYNGEFAYNKSYSVGFDFGSVKRLDKYSNGALSTLYICFALEDIVNSDFIVGYFDSCKWNRHVSKVCAEGARNHGLLNISADDFMKMNIYLPNLEEQKKIADFLTIFDKRITAQQNIIADLEETKKGLLQKIFSQEIRFKDDNGQDYQKWEKKLLADIIVCFSGGTPKSDEKDYYVGNIPFIRSGEIHKANTELHISEDGLANSSAKMVKKGDLLYALYGANSGECDISKISGAINQAVLCIRPIKDNVYYIFLWLSYLRKYIVSTFLQGGQGNLSATTIKRLSVMLPCIEEQRKIADFLSIFDKKITAEKQVLSDLQEIKKGLLQQMFV